MIYETFIKMSRILTFLNYVKSEKLEGTNYSFVKMIEHVYVTFLR